MVSGKVLVICKYVPVLGTMCAFSAEQEPGPALSWGTSCTKPPERINLLWGNALSSARRKHLAKDLIIMYESASVRAVRWAPPHVSEQLCGRTGCRIKESPAKPAPRTSEDTSQAGK